MSILWISDLYPPEKGGVATSAKRIVNNLRAKGLIVDVITVSGSGLASRDDIVPPLIEKEGGIELILKRQAKNHHTMQVVHHNARRLHKIRNYALIHGFFAVPAGYIATYSAKTFNIPSTVSFRGNDIDQVMFDYANKPFLNDTLTWANSISYASEEMLNRLKILKPDGQFFYTPISVNADLYTCGEAENVSAAEIKYEICPNGEKLLGIVGEFKFKKGLNFIVQALENIQKIYKTKLLVIGLVNKKDEKALLGNPLVHYKQFIKPDQMPTFYAAMDFLTIPSLFDGMPNVMLESMAAGTINITSDIAGMRDVIEDGRNGFRFFPLDEDDFLKAVEQAYSLSPSQILSFSQRAKEKAREYTPERETDSFLRLYNETLERKQ